MNISLRPLAASALLLSALTITSCSRYYYKPNGVNTPLFTGGNQGHLNLAGSIGSGDNTGVTNFFDVQGSYSPINHLGIIANYSTYNYTPDNYDYANGRVDAHANLFEAGIGGYYAVGKKKVKMVADFYGGGGVGSIRSDVDMKVNRFFLQPGIGMRTPWVDVAFNLRYSNVKYRDFDANGRDDVYLKNQNLIDQRGRRMDANSYGFFEPAITVRAGYKFAKVQFQGVLSQNVNNVYWDYNPARFTVGFYLSVEEIFDIAKGND